jgi:hypothetical protein
MVGLEITIIGCKPEPDCVTAGFDLTVIPDNPNRPVIEPGVHGPVISIEVQIAEGKSQDGRIREGVE